MIYARAHRRKLLGQPPTSPDKHSIGDELILESLIESAKGELIVVSRDKTFLENQALLKQEFDEPGNRSLILVTPAALSEALERAAQPFISVKTAEESIHSEKREVWTSQHMECPKCGGALEETGYEGSDSGSAWWLYCTRCGEEFFP